MMRFTDLLPLSLALALGCVAPKDPSGGDDSSSPSDTGEPGDSTSPTDSDSASPTDSDSTSPTDSDSTSPTDSDSGPGDSDPEPEDSSPPVDLDGDGSTDDVDCDDGDASVYPGATETCDEIDNDCDGNTDEAGATGATTWYRDYDGDSYGSTTISAERCAQPTHYVATGGDCDDTDEDISPAATELCDEIDNDCDGTTDEDDAADAVTCYTDADGDGYGETADGVACDCPSGTSAEDGDCDEGDDSLHPHAPEDIDGIDNDCDGSTDEVAECPDWVGVESTTTWTYDYADPGFEIYSTDDFTGEREVTATFDASTAYLSLSFETSASGRGYDGSTGRTEEATATYTCEDDGLALVSYELWMYEQDWFDYAAFEGVQNCTFDPPVLIIPSDLEEGATWTTSGVTVECYVDTPWIAATTAKDTLDFTFTADSATSSGTWGDALSITGDSFIVDGNTLELDFMADGAWVRGVGRVQDDKLDLTSYTAD